MREQDAEVILPEILKSEGTKHKSNRGKVFHAEPR